TVQKFYRVTGASTQYLGVVPDIILPDPTIALEVGEKSLEHSLKWDTTDAVRFQSWNRAYSVRDLQDRSRERVSKSAAFNLLKENVSFLESQKKKTVQSLEWESARAEQTKSKQENQKFREIRLAEPLSASGVDNFEGLPEDLKKQKLSIQKEWLEQKQKDLLIGEALQVLSSMKK
ncbi:MAG: carboxy terminal-processing peptidase, partial [Spirochaetia bacterium]|nr:carboxy terminal-processing peptidase [Spirochaetia bacterium]